MSDGTDYDDSNPAIIYSGDWQALTGTISQQFDNTVHQTSMNGASATIKFTGTRITVFQTVPEGDGTPVSVTINFDGDTSSMSRITRPGLTFYQDRWFDSGPLTNGVHLLILTNAGADNSVPLILDRFNVEGTLIGASSPPPQAVVTTTPSPQAPAPSTQSTKSISSNTPSNTNANSNTPPNKNVNSNTPSNTNVNPNTPTNTNAIPSTPSNTNVNSNTLSTPGASQASESDSSTTTPTGTESLSLTKSPESGSTAPIPASAVQTIVSVQYTTNANGSVSASTITLLASSAPKSTASNHGHPLAMIIGLSVAGLIAVALFVFLIVCLAHRRRKAAQLEDDRSNIAKPRGPTDVSPFHLDSERSLTSRTGGLARKANDTPTTNRRESTLVSAEPPTLSRGQSEKNSEVFSSANEPIINVIPMPSGSTANRIPETDTSPHRPTHLGRNMDMHGHANGVYASMSSPSDTNGPPPYQSPSYRNSGA